jgi:hypothetical protein
MSDLGPETPEREFTGPERRAERRRLRRVRRERRSMALSRANERKWRAKGKDRKYRAKGKGRKKDKKKGR